MRQFLGAVATAAAIVLAFELTRRLLERFGDELERAYLRDLAHVRAAWEFEREVARALPRLEYELWCAERGIEP